MAVINLKLTDYAMLLVEVIKADLKQSNLLDRRLSGQEVEVDKFRSNISTVLFFLTDLIKVDASNELKDWYFRQLDKITETGLPDEEELHAIASAIVGRLVTWKGPEIQIVTHL
jgi:hypothetical protein